MFQIQLLGVTAFIKYLSMICDTLSSLHIQNKCQPSCSVVKASHVGIMIWQLFLFEISVYDGVTGQYSYLSYQCFHVHLIIWYRCPSQYFYFTELFIYFSFLFLIENFCVNSFLCGWLMLKPFPMTVIFG